MFEQAETIGFKLGKALEGIDRAKKIGMSQEALTQLKIVEGYIADGIHYADALNIKDVIINNSIKSAIDDIKHISSSNARPITVLRLVRLVLDDLESVETNERL